MISSAEEFVALRTSEDPEEYNRAAHDEAPEEVWWDVIRRFPDMKKWVAHNKTVPLTILERLADDEDATVRTWVATKRKAGAAIFEKLSRDPDSTVRHTLVYNAKLPRHLLEALANDPEEFVAADARQRITVRKQRGGK